jgi:hypothetical protein
LYRGGSSVAATGVVVTGHHAGAAPDAIRLVQLSTGHYIGYTVLTPGTWNFAITATVGGRHASFTVSRSLG